MMRAQKEVAKVPVRDTITIMEDVANGTTITLSPWQQVLLVKPAASAAVTVRLPNADRVAGVQFMVMTHAVGTGGTVTVSALGARGWTDITLNAAGKFAIVQATQGGLYKIVQTN